MNPVVHFEMPYEDKDRAAKFYQGAFGWKPEAYGPEMGNYVVMTTTELDPTTHRPKAPGAINGGMFHRTKPDQYPSFVIAVDDIRAAMKKVADAGGKVIGGSKADGEPEEIPGVGIFCSIVDTEGNRISIMQPKGM